MNPVEQMVQYMMTCIMVRFILNDFAHAIGVFGQDNIINIVNTPQSPQVPKTISLTNGLGNGTGMIHTNGYKNGVVDLSSLITTQSMLDASMSEWGPRLDKALALALARSAL